MICIGCFAFLRKLYCFSGTSLSTTFTVECSDWLDDGNAGEQMGLEYGLYYVSVDSQGRTKDILLTKVPQVCKPL